MSEEYSVKVIEWGAVGPMHVAYERGAFEDKVLPSGFIVKDDGLYYEGTYEPGQSRCVMPAVNRALAALLGVDR